MSFHTLSLFWIQISLSISTAALTVWSILRYRKADKCRELIASGKLVSSIELNSEEPFDYTRWQQNLFEGLSVRELCAAATQKRTKAENKIE